MLRDKVFAANASSPPVTINTAWAWGCNGQGRLGDNTTVNKSSPVSVVGGFCDWSQVEAGKYHSLGVTQNGTAWGWGCNGCGTLGDNTVTNRSSPVSVVGGFTNWCQVGAGDYFSIGLRTDGTIRAWGRGADGVLGDNTVVNKSSTVLVAGGATNWCQISAGTTHSLGVRTTGTAWAWGSNSFGNLGDNTATARSSPVLVVGGFTDWCQVSAGCHSLAIRTNGTAWGWGYNGVSGRLGDNTITTARSSPVSVVGGFTDWCQVSAGNSHSLAVRQNGTAWAWGNGANGKLGDNTVNAKSSPVSVVGGFTDWSHVAAGEFHSVAIRTNGSAWAWGNNNQGQLGTNNTTATSSPVSVVGGYTDWCQVSANRGHSLAIRCT